MNDGWERQLARWEAAGVIDAATGERVRTYERAHPTERSRWPVRIAIAFGVLLLVAGLLLFVAAHWDGLSPLARFVLVTGAVAALHATAAAFAERSPMLSVGLHAAGTAALGGGILLTGQIFHLETGWSGGLFLWALGAWAGWLLLRQWPQGALAALLTPAWLLREWIERFDRVDAAAMVALEGTLLLAIVYLTAPERHRITPIRLALATIGAVAVLVAAIMLGIARRADTAFATLLAQPWGLFGWGLAIVLPLGLAAVLHQGRIVPHVVAAAWVLAGGFAVSLGGVAVYLWGAAGSIGLAAWGVQAGRQERINLGVAGFALTLLFFYFSSVMDKLGRSASLVGLGLLFLGGGYLLERARRRLAARSVA